MRRTLIAGIGLVAACSSNTITAPTPPCPAGYQEVANTHLTTILTSGLATVTYICVAIP